MTWPLVVRGASAGRIDSGDGQFSIWNVACVARTLVVDPRGLYDANIFYPHRGTLAYSEASLGAGLLAVPFYWASGGNPYVAHNAVVFLAFVLALAGTYGLVRHLTGHRGAAAVASVAYAFCPYVFSHIPHIQLLMWVDVDLTAQGRAEATEAGRQLKGLGLQLDFAYTSVLKRAIKTLWIVLEQMDQMWIPVHNTWRLNERHYGALQGLNKAETAAKHGEAQVKIWRRAYDIPPPPLAPDDERHPSRDRRYAGLARRSCHEPNR